MRTVLLLYGIPETVYYLPLKDTRLRMALSIGGINYRYWASTSAALGNVSLDPIAFSFNCKNSLGFGY